MKRSEAIALAKLCATAHHKDHPYLSDAKVDPNWQPHEWVIAAILGASVHTPALIEAAQHVVTDAMEDRVNGRRGVCITDVVSARLIDKLKEEIDGTHQPLTLQPYAEPAEGRHRRHDSAPR